jgi:hypothetical protein
MEGLKNEKELGNWANLGQTTRMSSRYDLGAGFTFFRRILVSLKQISAPGYTIIQKSILQDLEGIPRGCAVLSLIYFSLGLPNPSVLVEDRFPLWQADCKQLLLHLARPTYVGGV